MYNINNDCSLKGVCLSLITIMYIYVIGFGGELCQNALLLAIIDNWNAPGRRSDTIISFWSTFGKVHSITFIGPLNVLYKPQHNRKFKRKSKWVTPQFYGKIRDVEARVNLRYTNIALFMSAIWHVSDNLRVFWLDVDLNKVFFVFAWRWAKGHERWVGGQVAECHDDAVLICRAT